MPRASIPRSATLKGYIAFMGKDMRISIPIFAYKKNADIKKIELHMYHSADHGRVRYNRFCEECKQSLTWDDITKMAEWGNDRIEITSDELEEIFNKTGNVIKVIHPIPLSSIIDNLLANLVFLKEIYEVRPFKADTKKPPAKEVETMLISLFAALKANKQALLVTTSIDQIQRYALLFPNGDLWTLYYSEEIRADLPLVHEGNIQKRIDKELTSGFKSFLKTHESEISEEFSFEDMQDEMNALIEQKIPAKKTLVAVGEAIPTPEIAHVLKALKESVGKAKIKTKTKQKVRAKR
jgi:DNA end-binding protein Ku